MKQEEFNVKRININLYIILVAVVVSSTASFYAGSRFSGFNSSEEENLTRTIIEIEQRLALQNTTILGLNTKINELNEQLSQHYQLEEVHNLLSEDYKSLLSEYNDSRTEYNNLLTEYEEFKNQILGDEISLRTIIGNMSFTLPQRYIVHTSGLYESTATMESGILTASTVEDNTLISFSWDTLDSEPNLKTTLDNAFNSIGLILEYEMYLSLEVGDRNIIYSHYKTILENEYAFITVATWYDETSEKQYICIVQNTTDNVTESLQEFISDFTLIS